MKSHFHLCSTLVCVLSLATFSSVAHADPMAWVADGNGNLQSIDLTTGVSNLIGNTGQDVFGLADFGSNLYGVSGSGRGIQIFSIDTSNAASTPLLLNPNVLGSFAMGSTLTGLYVYGEDNNIYSMDPVTGAATLLGPTGVAANNMWGALSTGSSSLYIVYNDLTNTEQFLGQINTTTGALTPLGQITTDNPSFDAMSYIGGQWYIGTGNNPEVETLNISTLTATVVSQAPGVQNGFFGMAPMVTPEPAPLAVVGLGLAGFAFRRGRK